jgi:hypothetical protein
VLLLLYLLALSCNTEKKEIAYFYLGQDAGREEIYLYGDSTYKMA